MTEDHGLANGDGSVDVRESLELLVLTVTVDVVLFDVGQRLFLSSQSDQYWVGHDRLRKLHHFGIVRRREEQHLAILVEPPA